MARAVVSHSPWQVLRHQAHLLRLRTRENMMAGHRQNFRADKKALQDPHSNDVVAMEVDCALCTTRLYIPYAALDAVLASL